ncbi:MAG: chromosome segregation protein SMC, partial [Candidatus Omnitrophica bacterium]|nr:chromosome segregation protein SMC [Candidatus Omnitrophota bacterium]
KPSERREIFEEASGITKFRIRQDEALRKLKRTSQDLQRINDIEGELARQVRSLKVQAGKATRYNALHLELHRLELARVGRQRSDLVARIERGAEELRKLVELKASLEQRLASGSGELGQARTQVEEAKRELQSFQARKAELDSEIRRHDDQLAHCRAMESELAHQGERTRELERTLSAEREEAENALEEKGRLETRLKQELVELEVEESLLDSQENEGRVEFERARADAEEAHQKHTLSERSMEAAARELESLNREVSAIEERERRLALEAEEAEAEVEEIDAKFSAATAAHADTQNNLSEKEQSRLALSQAVQEIERRIEAVRTENERLRAERSRLNHRQESLRELQLQHEGQTEGVRQAFARRDKGEGPFDRIEGVLIEKVRVEPGYEDAVESALSAWLGSVVCRTKRDAFEILRALRAEGGGRVSCLPFDHCATRAAQLSDGALRAAPDWGGLEGVTPASHVVQVQPEYEAVLRPVLARTLIVRDLPQLETILDRIDDGWVVVTQQGEVALFPGVIAGGRAVSTGYLKRQSEIEENDRKLESLGAEWQETENELARLRGIRKQTADELKARETEIHDLVIRIAARREELQGLAQLRQKVEKGLESMRRQMEVLAEQRAALVEKRIELEQRREELAGGLEESREASARAQSELRRIEQALADLQAGHRRHRETLIALTKDHERCLSESASTRERCAQLEARITQLRAEDEERERKVWETLDRKNQAEAALKELFEKVDRVEQDLSEQEANLAQAGERLRGVEEQAAQVREMLHARTEEAQRAEMDLHRARIEMENLERRLTEELQSSWEACERTLAEWEGAPTDLEELSGNIAALRERIGKMGEINPLAVEEYAEQSQRLDFLTSQKEDLEKARTSLMRTLSEVKRSARKQFLETFEQVRQNFNRTFRRVFGGGRADLILLDEVDVLQTGVEIVAQPPGKKLQSITLMSGGEKSLTAIALLFAIYQVKASPFCFLDEVDAALDDANVDRFARLLIDYRDQTQFIIVTHNKHTMAVADRLYGVTMDKPGISTVMSMEFESRSDYNLAPLPEVDDDPLPVRDYDSALSANIEVDEHGEVILASDEPGEESQPSDEAELVEAG